MRRRRFRLVAALAALLLLGLVGITAGQVVSQGETHIVLASVPAQGRVPSVTALDATRAILVQRLGAMRSLFTQPPNVQIVTMGERQRLVVDVHLASGIAPAQVVMTLLGQVPQMVRDRQWSLHLPADNVRRSRLQEVMSLLRKGQLSILANGSTVLARGSSAARFPILASSRDIAPWSIHVAPNAIGPPGIVFTLQQAAAARVARYTSTHVGAYMAFALDHSVVDCPVIQGPIPTGRLQLFPLGTEGQAQALAALLKYGPTPTQLQIVSMH